MRVIDTLLIFFLAVYLVASAMRYFETMRDLFTPGRRHRWWAVLITAIVMIPIALFFTAFYSIRFLFTGKDIDQ